MDAALHRMLTVPGLAALLSAGYASWYASFIAARVHVSHDCSCVAGDDRMRRILELSGCQDLVYYPTFWAPTAFLQLCLLFVKELCIFILPTPYTRDTVVLRDGQAMAVDWMMPAPGADPAKPVVVLLHGAFQSSHSAPMVSLSRECCAAGHPVAVMNRRGYELPLSLPKACMLGFDDDLDEVLVHSVAVRFPGRPVVIVGFSAGATFSTRYVATRSRRLAAASEASTGSNLTRQIPRILCGVAIDCGFDVSDEGAISRMATPVRQFIAVCIWFQYWFRHRHVFQSQSSMPGAAPQIASQEGKLVQVAAYRYVRQLSRSFSSHEDWCAERQPELGSISVPFIFINSMDDPVTVHGNIDSVRIDIEANPNLALLEFARGGHGCKTGFFGFKDIAPQVVARFIQAVQATEEGESEVASQL
uniref:AB hydrolase-1 domain-containing protein n=1 Tax=Rhizochromulina marina TaxID=1034831 RepID=A0A7S2WFH1_9STRA